MRPEPRSCRCRAGQVEAVGAGGQLFELTDVDRHADVAQGRVAVESVHAPVVGHVLDARHDAVLVHTSVAAAATLSCTARPCGHPLVQRRPRCFCDRCPIISPHCSTMRSMSAQFHHTRDEGSSVDVRTLDAPQPFDPRGGEAEDASCGTSFTVPSPEAMALAKAPMSACTPQLLRRLRR